MGTVTNLREIVPEALKKQDRRRAPETAARILDAAESLFSVRGYHGVSLRDIAAEAGVQVALTHYHFGSKEDLFRSVIERRADEHALGISTALEQAKTVTGTRETRRQAVIRSFFAPIVEKSMRGGQGWKNYVRLLALVANMPQEDESVSAFRQSYDALIASYIEVLRTIDPEMDEQDVHWCFFFLQAAITHILVESKMLDRQSGGSLQSSDLDAMIEKLVAFFGAGFRGLGARED
ncbi:MAG: TetR family transcriptional regulator [Sphingobium sp.]